MERNKSVYAGSVQVDLADSLFSPLIELVKTPGRKKAIARKPKLASKLAQVVTMSLEVGVCSSGL